MSNSHPYPPEYDDDPRSDRFRPAHDQLMLPRFRKPGPEDRLPRNTGDAADPRATYTALYPYGKSRTANRVANQKTKSGGNAEITVYGQFPLPSEWGQEAKEVEVMKATADENKKLWAPTVKDFADIASKGHVCFDFRHLLADIVFTSAGNKRTRGAVRRINILTHGSRNFVAMKGTLIPTPAEVKVNLSVVGAITVENLDHLLMPGLTMTVPVSNRNRSFVLADVHRALSPEAELFLYVCGESVRKEVRDKLADVLQLKVRAFRERVSFCPKIQEDPPRILDRRWITLGACDSVGDSDQKTSDFRDLKVDRHASPKP